MKINKILGKIAIGVLAILSLGSCEKTKSYSELLKDEEHACNWYLAQHKVVTSIPKDTVFEVGATAPYYKLNKEGSLYMRVLNMGDTTKVVNDQRVYFSFMRMCVNYAYEGLGETWVGNAEDLGNGVGSTYFFYGNQTLSSSTQYGEGIQEPLKYLGLNSECELLVKSTMGFSSDISSCSAYVYKIRYFPAIY